MKPEQPTDNKDRRTPKSLLSGPQRLWLTITLVLSGLMLANTLYLLINRWVADIGGPLGSFFAVHEYTIPKIFQIMILGHTALGSVVTLLMLAFAASHLPSIWVRRRAKSMGSGIIFVLAGLTLAATGPFIIYAAASSQHNWVWWLHVVAAAAAPIAYVIHRRVSIIPPKQGRQRQFWIWTTATLAIMVVVHGLSDRGLDLTSEAKLAQSKDTYGGPGSKQRNLADYLADSHESKEAQAAGWVPASFVPPQSPFFPSATTTTTGDYLPERIITRGDTSAPEKLKPDLEKYGFVVEELIGAETCARCHPDSVEQWSHSAHRFASFNNPFYEATINVVRESAKSRSPGLPEHLEAFPHWAGREGEIKSKWCSSCHDPAVMLAGKMTDPIDRESPQAQAGLTCLACHAIDKIHNVTGNGAYNIADEQSDPYLFADAEPGTVKAFLHDVAIKARPEPHKKQMLTPEFRSSEFCSVCHKVSIPETINEYRWLRGQDEYDNWHDSGVALNAARTFYLPPSKRICADCHMPLEEAPLGDVSARNGKIRSHRFLAANTALPFIRGDSDTIERTEQFLRQEKLRIDIFAVNQELQGDPGKTVYHLDRTKPDLIAGASALFDVVVRNVGVGHTFPGGTNDSNQGWVEFTATDKEGQIVAQSGFIRDDGYVDPAAEFFLALLVDRDSKPIHQRNAQDIYAPIYVNVIGPGTAKAVHYRLTIPRHLAGQELTLRARLMWRKFDRAFTEFAYRTNPEGFKAFDDVPNLPVTLICSDEVRLNVVDGPSAWAETADDATLADEWIRYNDYGIGLLLQGDTLGAQKAFAEVARLVPDRLDGHRNLARVAIRDGDLAAAYRHLLRCEEIESNDPQTAWFWASVLHEDGRYIEAASAFLRVLQKFPEDRASWRQLGRTYYLDGKFAEAIDAFEHVLALDPENRVAYYHIMLSAQAIGRDALAKKSEAAYRKYKIDESAAEVTQAYRLSHPEDNLMSQPIHVHDLEASLPSPDAVTSIEPTDEGARQPDSPIDQ